MANIETCFQTTKYLVDTVTIDVLVLILPELTAKYLPDMQAIYNSALYRLYLRRVNLKVTIKTCSDDFEDISAFEESSPIFLDHMFI